MADGVRARDPGLHLMGTLVMLPIIIGYVIFVYWTFSDKVREGEGYHRIHDLKLDTSSFAPSCHLLPDVVIESDSCQPG